MPRITTVLLPLVMLTACSILPDKDKTPQAAEKAGEPAAKPQASLEAKTLAAESEAAAVTELTFPKGAPKLTKDAKARLDKLIAQLQKRDDIKEVTVISWADQEFPSVNAGDLPKEQRDLAENRNKAIEQYLKRAGDKVTVTTHNMAERPGAFERWLSTSDARVKKSLEVSGIPNSDTSVKTPSKASKAMVLLTSKE